MGEVTVAIYQNEEIEPITSGAEHHKVPQLLFDLTGNVKNTQPAYSTLSMDSLRGCRNALAAARRTLLRVPFPFSIPSRAVSKASTDTFGE